MASQNGLVDGVRNAARRAATYRINEGSFDATVWHVDLHDDQGRARRAAARARRRLQRGEPHDHGDVRVGAEPETGDYFLVAHVDATYDNPLYVPLVSAFLDRSDGVTDDRLTLTASEQMRVENPALDTPASLRHRHVEKEPARDVHHRAVAREARSWSCSCCSCSCCSGVSALAIDYASWLLTDRNLQNVADHAALAGASEFEDRTTQGSCGGGAGQPKCVDARAQTWTSLERRARPRPVDGARRLPVDGRSRRRQHPAPARRTLRDARTGASRRRSGTGSGSRRRRRTTRRTPRRLRRPVRPATSGSCSSASTATFGRSSAARSASSRSRDTAGRRPVPCRRLRAPDFCRNHIAPTKAACTSTQRPFDRRPGRNPADPRRHRDQREPEGDREQRPGRAAPRGQHVPRQRGLLRRPRGIARTARRRRRDLRRRHRRLQSARTRSTWRRCRCPSSRRRSTPRRRQRIRLRRRDVDHLCVPYKDQVELGTRRTRRLDVPHERLRRTDAARRP